MALNPYFQGAPPAVTREQFESLLRRIRSHLIKRAAEATIPDAELRALHPKLLLPAVWARVVKALDL